MRAIRRSSLEVRIYLKNRDAIAKLSTEQYRVTQQGGTELRGGGENLSTEAGHLRRCRVRRVIVRVIPVNSHA